MNDRLLEMGRRLAELKKQREELEPRVNSIKSEMKTLGEEYIKYCKENNVKGVRVDDRHVGFSTRYRSNLIDNDKAFEYFRMSGKGHIIKESIHSETLTSTVNELVKNGDLDIASAFEVGINIYPQEVISITKSK